MNKLTTAFIFSDADAKKIDGVRSKLIGLNDDLNNLGKTTSLGDVLVTETKKGTDALGKLAAGVEDLKTKTEKFAPAPTISRWYENEEKLVRTATERIAGLVDNAKASISNTNPTSPKKSPLEVGKPDDALFESVSKSRQEIQKLNSLRIDSGKLDGLTRAGVRLQSELKKTETDILRINNALKKPNSKTVIDELNNDLVKAQANFDKLSSKQQQYEKRAGSVPDARPGGKSGGGRRGITNTQATVLEIADDFAPEGFNRAFNGIARAALLAREAKDAAGEMSALAGISTTTLATFGAIAAVGAGIVIVTGNIRSEAEKRLRNEELIAGAINKQVLSLRESFSEYEKYKQTLRESTALTNRLTENVENYDTKGVQRERERIDQSNRSQITEINRLQADLAAKERFLEFSKSRSVNQNVFTELGLGREYSASQKAQDVAKAASDVEKTKKALETTQSVLERGKGELQQADKSLVDIRDKQDKAFEERWKSWQRSHDSAVKAQERAITTQEKLNKSVEDGKKKVEEMGKKYSSTFDDLFARSQKENPFAKLFADGDSELKKLRENLKGLDADLQLKAVAVQQKINRGNLFETRIDKDLEILGLRERARSLRNPQESEEQRRKRIDGAAERGVNAGNFFQGGAFGNYGSYLANKAGGFDKLTDNQKRDIYETRMFGNVAGNAPGSTFNTLNQNSLEMSLARDRVADGDKNLTLNDRLKNQIDTINSRASTAEERAIADRKLVALSQNINPNEIKGNLANLLAGANERLADAKSKYEQESLTIQKESLAVQKQMAENEKKLLEIAEKQGIEGLKIYLDIKDAENTKSKANVERAVPSDAGRQMDLSGTFFEDGRGLSNR